MRVALRRWLPVLAGAFGALAGPCGAALADQVSAPGFVPRAQAGPYGALANQEQVIAAVEKRYNAKVVKVAETTVKGRPALRLRLLSAQRVWSIVVDAATGQELTDS
jgi:hypothetical protein